MRRTLKKRISKSTSKKRKNTKRMRTRRGGMLTSRVSQSIIRRAEPHIERKTKEWGKDILEAKIKDSDIYKDTNKHVNRGLSKTLSTGIEILNDENLNSNPNINYVSVNKMPSIPRELSMPSSVISTKFPISASSSKNFLKAVNHPLTNITNTYNTKQNI
jgi:hypothetical protein